MPRARRTSARKPPRTKTPAPGRVKAGARAKVRVHPRVLIVDDEAPIRDALQLALERGPLEVRVLTASDGQEALEKLGRPGAEVVVADLKMPRLDGMGLLREVRQRHPETYFIMMTGFSTIETAIEALKLGAVDYITKPHLEAELAKAVGQVLEDIRFKAGFQVRKGSVAAHSGGVQEKLLALVRAGLEPLVVVQDLDDGLRTALPPTASVFRTGAPRRDLEPTAEWVNPRQLDELARRLGSLVSAVPSVVYIRDLGHLVAHAGEAPLKSFIARVAAEVFAADGELLLSVGPAEVGKRLLDEVAETITSSYYGGITRVISTGITHPIRRMVIGLLSKHATLSFSYIQDALGVGKPPKLSFHLARLREDRLVEQDGEKRYLLTRRGQKVAHVLDQLGKRVARLDSDVIFQDSPPVPGPASTAPAAFPSAMPFSERKVH